MKYQMIIRGPIGSWWGTPTEDVINCLNQNEGKRVDIAVCSLGGSVADALEIYQAFKDHGDVHVHIIGMTASAATFLAMGAKTVSMVKNALFLIHNASAFLWECDNFNKEKIDSLMKDLQTTHDNLKTIDDVIATMYADKSGKSMDEVLNKMKEEKWMTAQQTLDFGLIDEIREDDDSVSLGNNIMKQYANYMNFENHLPAIPGMNNESSEKTDDKKFSLRSLISGLKIFNSNTNKGESMKHTFKMLCALLTVDSFESTNNVINIPVADAQKIEDRLTELETKNTELTQAKDDAVKAKDEAVKAKDELSNKVAEMEKSLKEKDEQIKNLSKGAGSADDEVPDSTNEEMSCSDIYSKIR